MAVSTLKNTKDLYTASETPIGTWINGKTIYRKVLTPTVAKGANNISHGISNLDEIIKCYGVFTNAGKKQPIPRVVTDALAQYGVGVGDFDSSVIFVQFGSATNPTNAKIVLEYTKN